MANTDHTRTINALEKTVISCLLLDMPQVIASAENLALSIMQEGKIHKAQAYTVTAHDDVTDEYLSEVEVLARNLAGTDADISSVLEAANSDFAKENYQRVAHILFDICKYWHDSIVELINSGEPLPEEFHHLDMVVMEGMYRSTLNELLAFLNNETTDEQE